MARTKKTETQNDPQSDASKYKTAAAEERAMMRRLRAHRTKRMKEMEGMTNQEKVDYINRLGREAAAKLGITKPALLPRQPE